MAELKTQKQNGGVKEFVASIPDEQVRKDCQVLVDMMRSITGEPGDVWGAAMVGFGTYHYKYASGREADWFRIGFSPRKQNLTIYGIGSYGKHPLLEKLGPHSLGKGCLYVKRLADIDVQILEQLLVNVYNTPIHAQT